MEDYILEMKHISKDYGGIHALRDVGFQPEKRRGFVSLRREWCRKVHPDECTVRAVPAGAGNDQDERKACDDQ